MYTDNDLREAYLYYERHGLTSGEAIYHTAVTFNVDEWEVSEAVADLLE